MIKSNTFTNKILDSKKYIISIFCSLLILTLAWLGVFTDINSTANAQVVEMQYYSQAIALASNSGESIEQKAKNDLNTVLGAGTSDKVEGQIEQALGNIEQNLGEVTGQTKGVVKQVKGRAKQDIGRTKDAVEDVASEVENTTESAVDMIRDFFSN